MTIINNVDDDNIHATPLIMNIMTDYSLIQHFNSLVILICYYERIRNTQTECVYLKMICGTRTYLSCPTRTPLHNFFPTP